ncbi:Biotin carboxyl carrier protein of acetyl-CoA carboxylase [Heracleum sosnowskyi]|uniref:Biotin carboxyl carrier protein of acetyl-CoA carboxylase n=1 Tax=Heracleum sosnowskyi TaxID=360622 RepID=A0AAD8GQG8_9APIA|nr:Biotin carboxyl carrier protein of acetyl-CoA carboxylase [Heracleum sosnowskyi]
MASSSVLCTASVPQFPAGAKPKPCQISNISYRFRWTSRLPSSSSVAAKSSSNSAIITDTKISPDILAPESAISTLINEVSLLVKMVDSREIVELQVKQLGYELEIRKKEAIPKPQPAPGAVTLPPHYVFPAQPHPAKPNAPAPLPQPVTASSSPLAALSPSHPPLKCPMAGTFYRSPAPGEPPFVKVGDKVQKGQIICIIEAMKLMNEIEADLSGTVEKILVEDGKPVSVDLPLFIIVP